MNIKEKFKKLADIFRSTESSNKSVTAESNNKPITVEDDKVVELGGKPEVIEEKEKKKKEEGKEENADKKVTVTAQTEVDQAAFEYLLEQLKQGKKVDEAVEITKGVFYKQEGYKDISSSIRKAGFSELVSSIIKEKECNPKR